MNSLFSMLPAVLHLTTGISPTECDICYRKWMLTYEYIEISKCGNLTRENHMRSCNIVKLWGQRKERPSWQQHNA